MIKYKCPRCKERLENDGSSRGQRDTCPACGTDHEVPGSAVSRRMFLYAVGSVLAVVAIAFCCYLASLQVQSAREVEAAARDAEVMGLMRDANEAILAGRVDEARTKFARILTLTHGVGVKSVEAARTVEEAQKGIRSIDEQTAKAWAIAGAKARASEHRKQELIRKHSHPIGKWEGFRGIRWETSIDELPDMVLCSETSTVKIYRRQGEKLLLGDRSIKDIHYTFYRGQLASVTIIASSWTVLLDVLEEQFGPGYRSPGYLRPRIAGQWKSPESERNQVTVALFADERNPPEDARATLSYEPLTRRIMEDWEKERQMEAKKAAKDL